MADWAVVNIVGFQHQVDEGKEIQVGRLSGEKGSKIELDQILLAKIGDKSFIGQPLLTGAKIKAVITEQGRGEKIRVATYKSKSRYRRTRGFRAYQTKIKIEKIVLATKEK